ncbi:MAG: hypothetical protein R3C03_21875 [Pirellulaceae bacterium]
MTQPVHLTVFAGIGLGTLLVATIIYRAIKSRTRSASAIGQN